MKEINVKEIRERMGLSQTEFAKMLGVHMRTVQNYEAGGIIPESKYEILRMYEKKAISENKSSNVVSNVNGSGINISQNDFSEMIALLKKKDEQIDKLISIISEKLNEK